VVKPAADIVEAKMGIGRMLLRLIGSEDCGVTSIEYALLGALIAVAIAVSVAALGLNTNTLFVNVGKCFPSGNC
jgi:Flp pilus assembly pilin Flp